uniref:Uncharacterized protein n=1 Tax=Rhodosorus marinus TaxID=101924 RepID=A0A7S3E9U3_9RHOD|mmetsp:Transcript_19671/g.78240  ORF Transcript_19671/g.78240 Transcript_19671/m.78240 type:complete len:102 (+) Transcript_19671:140-445(+)
MRAEQGKERKERDIRTDAIPVEEKKMDFQCQSVSEVEAEFWGITSPSRTSSDSDSAWPRSRRHGIDFARESISLELPRASKIRGPERSFRQMMKPRNSKSL